MPKHFFRAGLGLLLLGSLQACIYPQAPGSMMVRSKTVSPSGDYEWIQFKPYTNPDFRKPNVLRPETRKNLLFIVADDVVQKKFTEQLQNIYKNKDIRLEDVLWWYYSTKIQKSYKNVLRVYWNRFNTKSLENALMEMESQGETYDVMLLAHGIPNHLIASPGQGVISWESIGKFSGKLRFARALYLQACFGNTLAPDFRKAGFEYVMAYENLNWNFFFPEYYLAALNQYPDDIETAFDSTVRNFSKSFRMNTVSKEVMKRFFKQNPKDYLESIQLPELY